MPKSASDADLRFVADCHLGKLAKYLRFMGYDTLYFSHIEDNDLVQLAIREKRLILSRDRELSQRKNAPVFYLEPIELSEQLKTLARELKITIRDDTHRRCLLCNTLLQTIDKQTVSDKIPARVKIHFDFFQQCPDCHRIYWQGDHYRRMMDYLSTKVQNKTCYNEANR